MNTSSDRRRFLRLMGLGSAAPLMLGIADTLVGRALGAAASRRIGIFFSHGETMPNSTTYGILPPGQPEDRSPGDGPMVHTTMGRLPPLLTPLTEWTSKIAVFDGLSPNMGYPQSNHGYKFASLCPKGDRRSEFNRPVDITVDQAVAQIVSRDTPVTSLLFGLQGQSLVDSLSSVFAAGPNKPLAHAGNPTLLYSQIVGKKATSMVAGGTRNEALLDARTFDLVREDINRLTRGLAGSERVLLDDYLQGIERYQKRQDTLRSPTPSGPQSCGSLKEPAPESMAQAGVFESRLRQMFGMATLGLQCGVTNVLGMTVGNGPSHGDLNGFRAGPYGAYNGHGTKEGYHPWMHRFYQFTMGLLADTLRGIGPLVNGVTALVIASNGMGRDNHHGWGERVPGFLLDFTGQLRTGGSYWRSERKGGLGRHTGDLLTTVTRSFGLPGEKFLDVGAGPIAELLP